MIPRYFKVLHFKILEEIDLYCRWCPKPKATTWKDEHMITHDNTCLHEKNAPLPSFCKESYGPQDIPENSPPVLIRGGFFASASEAVNQP